MFRTCTHKDVATSLETISAPFAIIESSRQSSRSAMLVSANSLFEEIAGRPISECIGLTLEHFFPRYVLKQIRACLDISLAKQAPEEAELVTEREGSTRWWRLLMSPILPNNTVIQRTIVTIIEITEKKLLEQKLSLALQRYAAVVESAYDGIITIDQRQNIKMINESALEIFGVTNNDVVGDQLSRFIPERFRENHAQYADSFRQSSVNVRPMQARSKIIGLRADKSEIELEVAIAKIKVGNEVEMTAVIRDISERTKLIEQLKLAAAHDVLTGINNRRHGAVILNSEIHRCQRFGQELSLVMFDIDYFKPINDTYGHACGDHVLTSVVSAVSSSLRMTDTFCRWGGDEFLVLLPETTLDDAERWAERVRETLRSLKIDNFGKPAITVTASFGVVTTSDQDRTPEDLLKRADESLYRAKQNGRDQVFVALA